MSQVSRPLQIGLAAVVGVFMLWFVALRPKPVAAPATAGTPQPVSGTASPSSSSSSSSASSGTQTTTKSALPGALGTSVDKAHQAAKTSDQANARAGADQPAGGQTQTKPLPTTVSGVATAGAATAGALIVPVKAVTDQPQKATLPPRAKAALADGKVLVLLFWNGKSSDDRSVHAAVRGLGRHGGKVFVDVASLGAIGRYSAVTNGVPVLGSPTVIVVGPHKKAVSFTGFVDKTNIDQAVLSALAA